MMWHNAECLVDCKPVRTSKFETRNVHFFLCWEPAWNTEKGMLVMWWTAKIGFGYSWLTCPITCFGITGVESTGWNQRQRNLKLQEPVFVLLPKYSISSVRKQSSFIFYFITSDMFQTCTSLSRASSHTTTEVPVYYRSPVTGPVWPRGFQEI